MNLQMIGQQYAAFRKTLGERFVTNGRTLKAFCRAIGPGIEIADILPKKVDAFLIGKGPLTTSWHVRHNALLGFYRYAMSRGFVKTSPLPFTIPKIPTTFQPYIYSPAELRRILDSAECRRSDSDFDASVLRALILLMYGAALRTSEALSLTTSDVDLSRAVLTIRNSKFFKSRLVPSDRIRFESLPNTPVVTIHGPGNPMIVSLLDGTRSRSPFICSSGLSSKSAVMRVCTTKAAPAASLAFMTYAIHRRFIG